jgi:hypothetical protein
MARRERGIRSRRQMPTDKTEHGDWQVFRVWANQPIYQEDPTPWKCLMTAHYLTCALEYIADCQDKGVDVVFQSPADCRLVKHGDQRVVYRDPSVCWACQRSMLTA